MLEHERGVRGVVAGDAPLDERSFAAGDLGRPSNCFGRLAEKFPATWVPPNIAGSGRFDPELARIVPSAIPRQYGGDPVTIGPVKKVVAGIIVLAGLAAAGILADQAVERDREYRRLIVQGDEALGRGQTFVAIEAYSGAIALKRGSMLAYLKRGEAHQRRGDTPETLTAALRDLRTAAELDPGATRTLEKLGDVNVQLRRLRERRRELRGVHPPRRPRRADLLQACARVARRRAAHARDLGAAAGGHAEPELSRGALRAGAVPARTAKSSPKRAPRSSAPSPSPPRSFPRAKSSRSCTGCSSARATKSSSSTRSMRSIRTSPSA